MGAASPSGIGWAPEIMGSIDGPHQRIQKHQYSFWLRDCSGPGLVLLANSTSNGPSTFHSVPARSPVKSSQPGFDCDSSLINAVPRGCGLRIGSEPRLWLTFRNCCWENRNVFRLLPLAELVVRNYPTKDNWRSSPADKAEVQLYGWTPASQQRPVDHSQKYPTVGQYSLGLGHSRRSSCYGRSRTTPAGGGGRGTG